MIALHLSDLHFGYDSDATKQVQRENLLNNLCSIIDSKNIDTVIVSGDIVWQCKADGFVEVENWLNKLSKKTKIPFSRFIIAPGNHEVDQNEVKEISYINDVNRINSILKIENIDMLNRRFEKFLKLCKKLGVSMPNLGGVDNCLTGVINLDDVKFWILNSSWYALKGGQSDKGNLWIGSCFYDYLHDEKIKNPKDITVCIMHHPRDWLTENETQTETGQKSLFELISESCDLCFTGHTHGNIQDPHIYHSHMMTFSAGACYQKVDYIHNFSIFSIGMSKDRIMRNSFESNNRHEWYERSTTYHELASSKASPINLQPTNIDSDKNKLTFKDKMGCLGISFHNVLDMDFNDRTTIIWPVVPRQGLTSIHLAQFEFMSILCNDYGCSIKAIISNCGANPLPQSEVDAFVGKIRKYCEREKICNFEYEYLDRYFMKEDAFAAKVLKSFTSICSRIKMPHLKYIKEKNYDDEKKKQINEQAVLDYILPILQFAVISALSHAQKEKTGNKSIVIAGNDEKSQWSRAVSVIGEDYIGALLLPELNKNQGKNINQDSKNDDIKNIIECYSKDSLIDYIHEGNIASWLYKMFIYLPNYIQDQNIDVFKGNPPADKIAFWVDENIIPDEIDLDKLVTQSWNRIEKKKCTN